MKNRLLGSSLVVAIICAIQTPVLADENISAVNKNSIHNIVNITPVDLVNSGYQGRLANFNIPGYGAFNTAVKAKKINSQVLVKSAIQSGRLEPEKINDNSYLNRVQSLLNLIDQD